MPEHTSYNHKIDLKEDFKPKRSKIFQIDPVNKETFNKFINENLWKLLKDTPQALDFSLSQRKTEKCTLAKIITT